MEQLRVQWTEFPSCLTGALGQLQHAGELADVTLACEGRHVHAHKLVLSACSPYFRDAFKENPCHHPIIILKDVLVRDVLNLLSYMYRGEVNVEEDDLPSFIQTAELLQIKGLSAGSNVQTKKPTKQPPKSTFQVWKNVTGSTETHKKTGSLHGDALNAKTAKSDTGQQRRRRNSASDKTTDTRSPDHKKRKSSKEKRIEPTASDNAEENVQKPEIPASSCSTSENKPVPEDDAISVKIKHEVEDLPEEEVPEDVVDDNFNIPPPSPPALYENSMLARSLLSGAQSLKADTSATISPTVKPKLPHLTITNVTTTRETPVAPTQTPAYTISTDENVVKVETLSPKSDIMEIEPEVLISEHHISISTKGPTQTTSRVEQAGTSASQQGAVNQNNHAAICGDCPHCGTKYSNQSALKYHVRLMHSDLTNRLCCHLCPRSFTMRETYKEHMWTSHGQRN